MDGKDMVNGMPSVDDTVPDIPPEPESIEKDPYGKFADSGEDAGKVSLQKEQPGPSETPEGAYHYGEESRQEPSQEGHAYGGAYQGGTSRTDYGPQGYQPYRTPKRNNMATASLVMGVLSILLCCCGGFGIILGAVGIVLAILSRGREPMETSAKVGCGLSIGGIILGIAVLIMAFAVIGSDEFRSNLYQRGYGDHGSYSHYFE